jgi:hypothetical protein
MPGVTEIFIPSVDPSCGNAVLLPLAVTATSHFINIVCEKKMLKIIKKMNLETLPLTF